MTGARRLAAWLYATAGLTYLADRITKLWAERSLAGRPPVTVIPSVLQLNYTTNSGGAFGLGQSAPWVFAAATIVVAAAIVASSFRLRNGHAAVALGLILGGAFGNLTDRAARGDGLLSGRVVDFIDFRVWPVFNLADSAIVIGALLLAVAGIRREREA
ncbi:MAG TPA: signal peptidase II [Actinomycetota bacterium]|nr:signal peptidase II [Actinomycetota bacterium]